MGVTVEGVIGNDINFWQQVSQGANGGRFACTAIAHYHHPTNFWVNHIQEQSQFHFFLTHNCSERKNQASGRGLGSRTHFNYLINNL
jgi:hypothetical protein